MQSSLRRLPWPEILILLLAAALRFTALELKPPHFDEGVNGWFADQMTKTGYYAYDPTNYHGPLHMYAVFLAQRLLGHEVWAIRMPVVLVSILCVWLTLRFGRFFGESAARWAAVAMAVSPAATFYGRYSIHETWLMAFLLLTAWGILELWKSGSRAGLFAIVAGFTGMVLTKETYFIHTGCFLLAIPCLLAFQMLVPSDRKAPLALRQWNATDLTLAILLGAFAIVFFYSGTFLHWPGLRGLYETYAAWFRTGVEEGGHAKTACDLFTLKLPGSEHGITLNGYWVWLMLRYEWPALIGLAACIRLIFPAPAQIRYLAIYGIGALIAYSIIPYKTPWLLLSMLWPFWFVFGATIQELTKIAVGPFVGALAVAFSLMVSVRLNFIRYDDPEEPYVYVQTHRSIHKLLDPIRERTAKDPTTRELSGSLYLDSYYPLPWIFGGYSSFAYPKLVPDSRMFSDVIVAEQSKAPDVERHLADTYYRREFRLRDAQEDCVVWFRASLFKDELEGERTVGPAPNP